MSLIGRTLLHYRIVEKVGEGGMGAVYRARDAHLDRTVALKVLPHDKMADQDRRQRFVQEAKAASSLNHPNIVVVHDIASDQGVDFIVMEFVEGQTLDQLIGRKGLPLSEALGYAAQLADGLAKAHAAGIVHRDLKPTNVMVTAEGRVKILDFGLAKLVEEAPDEGFGPTATLGRPEKPKTEEGFILGTVAYMSPEQAEGRRVDSRSDVFSFGSVLYEMLTGRKAFHGESRIATLAAILREEPKPATSLVESLPPEVEQVLARCLRKDPQRRWQNMSDLRVVLQDLKDDSESGKLRAPTLPARASRRRLLAWLVPGATVFAAAIVLWLVLPRSAGPTEFEITRLTFDSGWTGYSTISPDGQMIAFSSDRSGEGHSDIWVQQLAGGTPLRRTTNPADDGMPAFSPDGSKIVFASARDGGGLFEIGTLAGEERRIAGQGGYPRYSSDGAWISFVRRVPDKRGVSVPKMYLIPARGGDPVPFRPEFNGAGESAGMAPVWSPDGRYILFNGRKEDDPASLDWWVAPVSGSQAFRTGAHATLDLVPTWQIAYCWAGPYVYYSTGTTVDGVNLFRVRIDPDDFRVTGPPERITSGAGMQFWASALPDGRVVYSHMNWFSNIWTAAAEPDEGLITGTPSPVAKDLKAKFDLSLSRDGGQIAYTAFGGFRGSQFEVRRRDLASGEERVFPMRAARFGQTPRLSPDGSVLSYCDAVDGKVGAFVVAGREESGREVCQGCVIEGFYADPGFALIREENGDGLARLKLATGERTPVLGGASGRIVDPELSPDDRWLAFALEKPDGRMALSIAPLAADGRAAPESGWILIEESAQFLASPAWSPAGSTIYFLSERDGFCCVWARRLDPRSKAPSGESLGVYHAHQSRFRMNFPRGDGALAVARGKIAFWMSEATGNIYMAKPKKGK